MGPRGARPAEPEPEPQPEREPDVAPHAAADDERLLRERPPHHDQP